MATLEGESFFSETETEAETTATPSKDELATPSIFSEEWTNFILSKLRDDEQVDKHPSCDGLRRLVEEYIGPITERRIVNCIPPNGPNGISTVVVSIKVNVANSSIFPNRASFTPTFHTEDIADVGPYNTEKPYCLHQSATAATRAEARCYRKILRLKKVVALEEITPDGVGQDYITSWQPQDSISEQQINILTILCERNDIHVMDLINAGSKKYNKIEEVTKEVAIEMIQYLNEIQQGVRTKPANSRSFTQDWRNS